jgi:hypothetical protein
LNLQSGRISVMQEIFDCGVRPRCHRWLQRSCDCTTGAHSGCRGIWNLGFAKNFLFLNGRMEEEMPFANDDGSTLQGYAGASFFCNPALRSKKTHSAKPLTSGNFQPPRPGSVEDLALGTLAALSFQSLLGTTGFVMLCLMALIEVLK